ncbi:MAG: Gfo/Idh/MocA family protein [Dictyoglomaceae bacterium]
MVRIGMASFAHMHAFSYINCVLNNPSAKLIGIWDENEERGRIVAQNYNTKFYPSYEELLKEIDGVIICSSNKNHMPLTIKSAEFGKHVLCEKPLATSIEDGKKMLEYAEKNKIFLMTAFPVRFAPPAYRVKELIESNVLGKILAIKSSNHGKMPGGWFIDKEEAGGGAVMDHTVHVVDLIRWYTGKEFTSVYAEIDSRLHPDINIDDCGILLLTLEDDTFVSLDPSWSRPNIFPTWGDVTMEIIGTKGTITLDVFAQNIVFYNETGKVITYENWGSNMDYGLVSAFIESIKENKYPPVTGYDGYKAMEVAIAAYLSYERKEPVKLPL